MGDPVRTSPGAPALTPLAADVPPSGRWGLLLRLGIALGLVTAVVQLAVTPLQRPLDDLLGALTRGEVTAVTIERPTDERASGFFHVSWDGGVRPHYARYEHAAPAFLDSPPAPPVPDQLETILLAVEQSPADVEVVERRAESPTGGTVWWQPAGIAVVAALLLLVAGDRPRLVTRWAWCWLFVLVPPALLAFVLLEPTPLWDRTPQPAVAGRLTAGYAVVLGLVAGWLLGLVPAYRELFPG